MKRVGESVKGQAENVEFCGQKLIPACDEKGGQSTPVASFWRPLELRLSGAGAANGVCAGENLELKGCRVQVSARKLAASFWELNNYRHPFCGMRRGGGESKETLPWSSRFMNEVQHSDPLPDSPEQVGNSNNVRKHASELRSQLYRSVHSNSHAIRAAVSPSSYSGSMEITPYNAAAIISATSSSLDLKEVAPKIGCCSTTSTELLKVLNRIWRLEDQHNSNITLVKLLKTELEKANSQIKLLQHVERNSQKNPETLQVSNLKTELIRVAKERESERRSRVLLEKLCDEFALGITDYGKKMHSLRIGSGESDPSILHFAESWLDERKQMMLKRDKIVIVDKLSSEIEAFLENKRNRTAKQRSSLESFPLNNVVSAPLYECDEDEESDSHCFELEKLQREENNPKNNASKQNRVNKTSNKALKQQSYTEISEHVGSSSSRWRNQSSPVRQWRHKLPSHDPVNATLESSSLKAKLLEVRRTKGQRSSRLKTNIPIRRG